VLEDGAVAGLRLDDGLSRALVLGDVVVDAEHAEDLPARRPQGNLARAQPHGPAVRRGLGLDDVHSRDPRLHHRAVIRPVEVGLLRPCHVPVVPAYKPRGVVEAGVAGEKGVAAEIAGFGVLPEDPDGYRLDDQPQHVPRLHELAHRLLQLAAFLREGFLRALARGDVPRHGDHVLLSVLRRIEGPRQGDGMDVAPRVDNLLLAHALLAGIEDEAVMPGGKRRRPILEEVVSRSADQLVAGGGRDLTCRMVHQHEPVPAVLNEYGLAYAVDNCFKTLHGHRHKIGRAHV
jgi:hypothetical protein